MAEHEISVDRARALTEQPDTGHNRWHPDIPPLVRCAMGDEVVIETRDALDGQVGPDATVESVAAVDLDVVHPLTGPVYVEGAEPGDLLEIDIVDVEPDTFGFTVEIPGFGFLRDVFTEPFLVRWEIGDGWATSHDLPGVRIPGAPFMGTIGVAPSRELMSRATAREQACAQAGGLALPPSPAGAVPASFGEEALRTIPPRENGGNVDIKQLVAGSRLLLPVHVPGALFSAGDAHFAQGDCETCGTAIEMRCRLRVRFGVRKGEATDRGITGPRFERDDYYLPPEYAAPRRFLATTGMPVTPDGENRSEDLTLAARNALLAMIDLLGERGYSRQQAYALCSTTVDLKISQLVDAPNVLVSAFLPLDVFTA